ncbi:MAG: PEP-CTERM sorting domain-containing protein [Akkermansia sp.]|nr:PEP-CTERM sorting domain-containing protein [Akkermansia sp.]
MKKTLSILAVAALAVGTTLSAADVTVRAPMPSQSTKEGSVIAQGARLINSSTGGVVVYDIEAQTPVYPPFDITDGRAYGGLTLKDKYNWDVTLDDVKVTEDQGLVIEFTNLYFGPSLTEGLYYVVTFSEGNNFAEWYAENPTTITGKFPLSTDALPQYVTYTGYVVDYSCDQTDPATTYGGLVFFDASVADAVLAAEVPASSPSVPEPTTATLSLLALAGLAARRRRR